MSEAKILRVTFEDPLNFKRYYENVLTGLSKVPGKKQTTKQNVRANRLKMVRTLLG